MFGSPYKTSDRTITGTITPVGHAPYRNRGRNRRRGFLRAFLFAQITQFLYIVFNQASET